MKNLSMKNNKTNNLKFNESLELLSDYPFQRLNNLLKNIKTKKSKSPIILSIGEPRHQPPNFIKEIINKNFSKWKKYPPTLGMKELNISCIAWLKRRYNLPKGSLNPDQNIVQLAGTREGLFNIALSVNTISTKTNKPIVLMPDPFYQVYDGAAKISGAKSIYIKSLKKNRFIPDFCSVNKKTLEKTSMIYICSPSNPEGSALNIEEWNKVISLAKKYNIILVADECYTDIYIDKPPLGILEACIKLNTSFDNIICFHSLSKRSNVPGLRSGFAAGDAKIINNFKKLRHFCAGQQPIPIQEAATSLWNDDLHASKNRLKYKKKFLAAREIFEDKFNFYIPDGGFYLWLNVKNGEKITKLLWREKNIKVMPGAYLSNAKDSKKYIRVALVLNFQQTKFALQEIYDVLKKNN